MLSRSLREVLTGGVFVAFTVGCGGESDRETLAALYYSWGGSSWANNSGWLDDGPLDNWYGIDANGTEVFGIDLSENDLSGSFHDEFDDDVLPGLNRLILDNNDISGSIPTWIGSLSSLRNLDLQNNNLEGTIPPELGQATFVTYLHLGQNSLTGSIPSELGNLTSVTLLKLNDNNLEGIVPDDVWGLSLMVHLDLGGCNLAGTISSKVGDMEGLLELDLRSNSFSGEIPTELGTLAAKGGIISVDLSDNYLTGSVPEGLDETDDLDLSGNKLDGWDDQRTGLAYRRCRPRQKHAVVEGPCKKLSIITPFPPPLQPVAPCPAVAIPENISTAAAGTQIRQAAPSRSGDTKFDASNGSGLFRPKVLGPGNRPPLPPRTDTPSPTASQPSTQHPSVNESSSSSLVPGRGSHDDPALGWGETKLDAAERHGGSAFARSPSTFNNTVNQILHATRITASAAQSSSVTFVPEVATLVEKLVGLAEDSRTNPDIVEKSKVLCRWLKMVLESADQLPGLTAPCLLCLEPPPNTTLLFVTPTNSS